VSASLSSFEALHAFLTGECALVAEPAHSGSWRTYFFKEVVRHPARTTRTAKLLFDHAGTPCRIQLCVSSDNNNSVFMPVPCGRDALKRAIEQETAQLMLRLAGSPDRHRAGDFSADR
jgi:hypothetical protein